MGRPYSSITLHSLNVTNAKIANPNTLDFALTLQLLQCLIYLFHSSRPSTGRMYEKEINITLIPVDLVHAIQAFLVGPLRTATGAQNFGGEEEFVARYAGLSRRFTHFRLILVILSGVYVAVSGLEGCEARLDAEVGGGLIDAKTKAGNLDGGVGEREEICQGEFGGRHGGGGLGIVICFSVCSAFICGLELGGQRLVVRMDMSAMRGQ